jgi:hypothetical protein
MKPDKLIHIPPGQLDPQTLYWLEEDKFVDIFEDDLKHIGEWEEAGDWDDNKQHTEQSI